MKFFCKVCCCCYYFWFLV